MAGTAFWPIGAGLAIGAWIRSQIQETATSLAASGLLGLTLALILACYGSI
jgi:hypothetical protein